MVDDDPVFAAFVEQLVLSLGAEFPCTLQWVDSAERGLEELGRASYDLVLLDYHLPGADGLHVLAQIRELPTAQQPAVIMLTGSGNESVAVEAMKRGAKDYLCKAGLEVAPLLRVLNSALTQKQLEDQVASYNTQMRADLELARRLQQSLLPVRFPVFRADGALGDSALRFEPRFIPAMDLAGDFFSVLALSESQAGVFICDVMGHGVRSALVTAMMHALVENEAPRTPDPGEFLAALNRRLTRLIQPEEGPMYVTAFYGIADVATGQLRYANAGHPRPLHLRRRLGTADALPAPRPAGPALGMYPDANYGTGECSLEVGDVLLLFTDGLYEVASADGAEDYGKARLQAAAKENLRLPAGALCEALIGDVRRFSGRAEFADDVCLLGVDVVRLANGGS
ncbi:MAG: Phosphoserine phosphatase RsbP [Verrucomicrobiota bacterium]|jgi:sigma-B regulation protein RsbU (phosphoserine phosphatase)